MDYGVSVASLAPSHSEVTVSHLGTFIHQSDGLGASVASLAHAHSKVTIPRTGTFTPQPYDSFRLGWQTHAWCPCSDSKTKVCIVLQ